MRNSWWLAVIAVGIVALGGVIHEAATRESTDRIEQAQERNDLVSCGRTNATRAVLRADVRYNAGSPIIRTATFDRLFPILDCEASVSTGRNVPLPPEQQRAFIERLTGRPLVTPGEN